MLAWIHPRLTALSSARQSIKMAEGPRIQHRRAVFSWVTKAFKVHFKT
jgi:hypothetical protein